VTRITSRAPELLTIAGLYLLSGALVALAFVSASGAGGWGPSLHTRPIRWLIIAAAFAIPLSCALLLLAYRLSASDRRTGFWLPAVMVAASVMLGLGFAEAALRILAKPDPRGVRIGSTVLLPYDWRALARESLARLQQDRNGAAFYVEDSVLGWTVGPNRKSADGLYASSAEGLRSRTADVRLADTDVPNRIALLGDSFAFSDEVGFDASLQRHLEQLTPNSQVLNFGVNGYGIDQALLRFRKESINWRPRVAILVFIHDDLYRAANVYPFLKKNGTIPLSKARYVLRGDELDLLNVPNAAPERMFNAASILDLPLLDDDIEFSPNEWRPHLLRHSYVFSYLAARFPTLPSRTPSTTESAVITLNRRLIQEFVRTASAANISPAVVYLPTRGDFSGRSRTATVRLVAELEQDGIAVTDVTACMTARISAKELFVTSGVHYSDGGNAAAAECIHPVVARYLQ